jgi:predicted DNA-binding transcriptional regulator AlpA
MPSPLVSPDASTTTPEYVTTSEAARMLGISAATIRTWRTRGGGPPARRIGAAGRLVRYAVADLRAFAEARPAEASTSDVPDAA